MKPVDVVVIIRSDGDGRLHARWLSSFNLLLEL